MDYEYKLLRQFTHTTVGGTTCYLLLKKQSQRATHCRATRSVFALISEQNRAAVAERLRGVARPSLLLGHSMGTLASSPGHSQILSRSRGEKSGEGLVPLLYTSPTGNGGLG